MKKIAVFGLASSEELANRIVDRLLSSGFAKEDISVLYSNENKKSTKMAECETSTCKDLNNKKEPFITEAKTKAAEGAAAAATAGGIVGGSLGLLAGMGAIAIPGLGPFIAAGPIIAALSGSGVGGGLGLLIGSLVGSGIPEEEAKKFETGLKSGNVLVSVHTVNSDDIIRAREILRQEGAKEISSTVEKAA